MGTHVDIKTILTFIEYVVNDQVLPFLGKGTTRVFTLIAILLEGIFYFLESIHSFYDPH